MTALTTSPIARPFLKWAGGKTQLLDELKARVPSSWSPLRDLYVEPFLGAGALYLKLKPLHARLNDLNAELIVCWQALRDCPHEVCEMLGEMETQYRANPEDTYYSVRMMIPSSLEIPARAARFIMLNKAGFNGLYRVNKHGHCNVPWGQNKWVNLLDVPNLNACSDLLQSTDVELTSVDFADVSSIGPGALVYLDPPYAPVSKTSDFTAFTKEKFRATDQKRLASYALKLSKRGCHVIVSQSADPETVKLYSEHGFTCDLVSAKRKINSKASGRGDVGEYIIHKPGRGGKRAI
jgi:DNA adenine methylase